MLYYLALKGTHPTHAIMWMYLENIVLSEKSPSKKDEYQKRKLHTNISEKHRCKNSQQNINRFNSTEY